MQVDQQTFEKLRQKNLTIPVSSGMNTALRTIQQSLGTKSGTAPERKTKVESSSRDQSATGL